MIITLDGVNAKRGKTVWEIGVTIDGFYMPSRGLVHSLKYRVFNEERCWSSYDKCKAECDKLNGTKQIIIS